MFGGERFTCPRFQEEPKSCCRAQHEELANVIGSRDITVSFTDGREMIIRTYTVMPTEDEGDSWVSLVLESAELQQLQTEELDKLSPRSLKALGYIHPKPFVTKKPLYCPLDSHGASLK